MIFADAHGFNIYFISCCFSSNKGYNTSALHLLEWQVYILHLGSWWNVKAYSLDFWVCWKPNKPLWGHLRYSECFCLSLRWCQFIKIVCIPLGAVLQSCAAQNRTVAGLRGTHSEQPNKVIRNHQGACFKLSRQEIPDADYK
jgi:hypothetical protein